MAEAPLLSTSAKNRCVLRVERLRPPACPPLIPDTAPASRGRGKPPFHRQPETSACYSGPSMPCRRSPSSGRRKPTISALLPPIEEDVIVIQSVGCLFIYRLRRWPQPRYAVRRCTDYTPAVGQPLHSLRVCLRLRARAGRHIVLVQAHDKVPVAPCLRDTCCLR